MVLINGKRLVREIKQELLLEGIGLDALLTRELDWYHANLRSLQPSVAAIRNHLGSQVAETEDD